MSYLHTCASYLQALRSLQALCSISASFSQHIFAAFVQHVWGPVKYMRRPCTAYLHTLFSVNAIYLQALCSAYYLCKPCAAFVSAFADFARNIFSSTAQSIFAGPAKSIFATPAHHISALLGFGLCSTPCPAEIGVAYR